MISHDDLLNYCIALKITPNQFNFCYLTYIKDWNAMLAFSKVTYFDGQGRKAMISIKRSEVDDLVDRGFLLKVDKDGNKKNSHIVTEKFGRLLFIDETEAGEELWKEYFDCFIINGVYQSAKTCDKDAILDTYLKKIRRSKKKHKEVMDILKEYKKLVKENKMNAMGIEKFVLGENWEVVKKIRENTAVTWDDSV